MVWELAGRFGLPGAAAAWLPALIVSQILSVVFLRRILGRPFAGLFRPLLVIAGVSVLCAWVAYRVDLALSGLPGLVVGTSAAAVLGGALLLLTDRRLGLGLGDALARVFPKAAVTLGYSLPDTEPGQGGMPPR